ncbi:MAG: hypothetical protein WC526_00310 [Patescibacteria group bacterium]
MFVLKKIQTDNRGLQLIEVLVALGIFVLLVGAVVAVYLTGSRYNSVVWEQLSTQNEGRKATQDFVNQIRTASQSSIGAYPVQAASSTGIIFYSNTDSDSLVERLRYFTVTSTLKMGIIKPTGNPLTYNPVNEIVINVANELANATSVFYYYDGNYNGSGAPLASPIDVTKIRVVRIILKLDQNPNLTPAPFYIESKAMLRNLKNN